MHDVGGALARSIGKRGGSEFFLSEADDPGKVLATNVEAMAGRTHRRKLRALIAAGRCIGLAEEQENACCNRSSNDGAQV